jgi:hypothetical protein
MDTTSTLEAENGYRYLNPEEVIQEGDEYRLGASWTKCETSVGDTARGFLINGVRRRVEHALPSATTTANAAAASRFDGIVACGVVPKIAAIKHDDDKPAMALLPAEALEEVAKVLTFGAKKYSAHNWRGGFGYTRILSAVLRHTFAFLRGEDKDPETGLSHLAHAICGLMFCLTFTKTKPELDDRYKAAS